MADDATLFSVFKNLLQDQPGEENETDEVSVGGIGVDGRDNLSVGIFRITAGWHSG